MRHPLTSGRFHVPVRRRPPRALGHEALHGIRSPRPVAAQLVDCDSRTRQGHRRNRNPHAEHTFEDRTQRSTTAGRRPYEWACTSACWAGKATSPRAPSSSHHHASQSSQELGHAMYGNLSLPVLKDRISLDCPR